MTDFSPKHDATNWVDYVNQGSTSELKQGEGMKNLGDQIRGVRRLSLEQIAGALNNRDIPAGLTEPQKAALKSTWETELMEKLVEEKAKAMPAEALEKISAIGSDDDGLEDVKAHAVAAFERVIGARKDRNARENAGKKVRRLTTLGRKTADATEEERRSTGRHRSLFLEASVLALKDLRLPSDHLEALEKLLSERQKITEQIEDTEVQQSAAQERLDIHAQKVEKFKSFRTKLTKWIVGLGTLGPALPVILPKTLGLVVGGLGKGVSLLAGSAKLSIASGKAFSYLWALGGKGFIGWAAMPHIALAGIGTYVAVRLALQVYRSKKLQHLNFFTETGRAARQHGKAVRSREGNKIPIWNRIETLFGKEPTRVGGLKRSLTSADKKIKKHMETLLPERSALVSRYKTLESHKEAAQTRLTETEAEMARLEGAGRTSAPAYQTALEKKDQYEKEIAEYDQLLPRLARVLAEYSKCDEVLESHLPAMATELIKEQHGVPDEVKELIGDAMRKVEDQV
ncbi:MAG: hypothetical protein Q8P95_04350, partial [bacterium]|nr:hypothetical protein [bacterium]